MDISVSSVSDRTHFIQQFVDYTLQNLSESESDVFLSFAKVYLEHHPIEEWVGRKMSDLFGCCRGLWFFLQSEPSEGPSISVFNPNIEAHGWVCGRTVLTVLQKDMHFLVDSILIELNRRGIHIHVIKSTVMTVSRQGHGKPVAFYTFDEGTDYDVESASAEALIYVEINLHADEGELSELEHAMASVLADVSLVVDDYHAMLAKACEVVSNISAAGVTATEAVDFIDWLQDKHFTFLGYREYRYVDHEKNCDLLEIDERRLGLFSKLPIENAVTKEGNFVEGMKSFHASDEIICFSKSSTRSTVHRGVYPDYVVLKKFDSKGRVSGEVRFLGLFTYAVYHLTPVSIPIIRKKVKEVVLLSGINPLSHDGKNLRRVIENFPRDELFQSDTNTLLKNLTLVTTISERHLVRLIMRRDPFGSFVNCLVYIPREVFATHIRVKVQELLGQALESEELDTTTFFSESTLVRAQFIFRIDNNKKIEFDTHALEEGINEIVRNWDDELREALIETLGETAGIRKFSTYNKAFSQSYKENFDAREGAHDIAMLEVLKNSNDIAMNFYQPVSGEKTALRFKVMHLDCALELSDVIPILENLGLRVRGEHPFKIVVKRGSVDRQIWLHDFKLEFSLSINIDVRAVRRLFEEAFLAVWQGQCESDAFNLLVLGARLSWREVSMLRAYARYMKQIQFVSSQSYIADTLVAHVDITRNIVALFKFMFDPRVKGDYEKDGERITRLRSNIVDGLDQVENLNEERVLLRYLDLLKASLRTNFFQKHNGEHKEYIAIKFSPQAIPGIPLPRPKFEIFVYSPRVEGVHLRGGKVARGGLRWSDRLQDYRTEVLGLAKAQQVKNAVIVPSGAKGGFVAKHLHLMRDRESMLNEGVECYKIFIQGLLDITDNLVNNTVVPPEAVRRMDEDDPYLVVAADKGTATFSDIANEISLTYNFWLGDGFASGGSQGYDHKAMGITARGAWVSVQRHFRENGIDIQSEDFTVVGIGDMAGDVFGNGMLLSEHIQLVAAFNHMHIFIDPTPDSKVSYKERERLFQTPRTTWADYNKDLISPGGGVFSRQAKYIAISAEIKAAFKINEEKLTPVELISKLLKAEVDLIWNGGIGTYVKASWETHSDVGDKANDVLRINGDQLRCKVFGEGGNLGITQLGRVEYALNGGACNTDFIDNAAGVDCSDHEVNIKILVDKLVDNGDLTSKQRNKLLVDMTNSVSKLVLQNNYRQTLAISNAEYQVYSRLNEYRRFISYMESTNKLDRDLEFLPSDEDIIDRQGHGKALTRPELSVLISYAKVALKDALISSDIASDTYIAKEIESAFPDELREKYKDEIYAHALRKEIVGTQVANDFINNLGITSSHRLLETTGASMAEIAKAYIVSRDIFQFEEFQHYIHSLDNQVDTDFQSELMANMIRRVRRGTRWFLRNRRGGLNPNNEIETFKEGLDIVYNTTQSVVEGSAREEWLVRRERLAEQGVPENWALKLAMPDNLFSGLGVVEAALDADAGLEKVTETYFAILDKLNLHWFATQLSDVKVETYWQALARESFIDDLEAQLRKLTVSLLHIQEQCELAEALVVWADKNILLIDRWKSMVNEVQGSQVTDYAMFSVALRELMDLTQATKHG